MRFGRSVSHFHNEHNIRECEIYVIDVSTITWWTSWELSSPFIQRDVNIENFPISTVEKLELAVKMMKNKSFGPDEIPSKHLKTVFCHKKLLLKM